MFRNTSIVFVVSFFAIGCGKEKVAQQEPPKTVDPLKKGEPESAPPKDEVPAPKGGADFTLTAVELEAEIKKDRKAAHAKYKGKSIELSGTIRSTAPNSYAPITTIDFAGADRFGIGVLCSTKGVVPPDTLAKGQTVRVRGTVSDAGPMLVECAVLDRGPDTAIRTTAEQLAKDNTEDRIKAIGKYDGKTLVVKGEVAAIKSDPAVPLIKFLELKGDGKTVIQCRFGASDQEVQSRDSYKVGDPAVFVCEFMRSDKDVVVVSPCHAVPVKK